MITLSIFWALVLALFATNLEQPLLWKRRHSARFAKGEAWKSVDMSIIEQDNENSRRE